MAFTPDTKRKILRDRSNKKPFPCVMCGSTYPLPEAAHIIDQKEWKKKHGVDRQVNGIPLCPNCHKVFEEILRPYLYSALSEYGCTGLPDGWKKSNKVSTITTAHLPVTI